MAAIQTYATEIDILGHYYEVIFKYVQEKDNSIELLEANIINENKGEQEFPILYRVEADIIQEIKESLE